MTKLAPEWVRTSDPVIRSPACYRWTMAPAPTLSQRPAVAAEEARTVGTVNVQCRSNDQDYVKTTVMKLPTDFVKLMESTPLASVAGCGQGGPHRWY